jgi:hypothetical protein
MTEHSYELYAFVCFHAAGWMDLFNISSESSLFGRDGLVINRLSFGMILIIISLVQVLSYELPHLVPPSNPCQLGMFPKSAMFSERALNVP